MNNVKVGDRIEDKEAEGNHFDWVVEEVHREFIVGTMTKRRIFTKKTLIHDSSLDQPEDRFSGGGEKYFREVSEIVGEKSEY